jgi:hypothetical protein
MYIYCVYPMYALEFGYVYMVFPQSTLGTFRMYTLRIPDVYIGVHVGILCGVTMYVWCTHKVYIVFTQCVHC